MQDLFLELVELHAAATEAREDAARALWLQRARRAVGWLLALSGSWRVAMAVVHVAGSTNQRAAFASRAEGADAATAAWLLLHRTGLGSSALGQFVGRRGLPFWSQGVGLVLVASLGLASASGFLSAVQRARRASLTTNQPSSPAPAPLLSSSSSTLSPSSPSSGSWALSAESLAPLTTLSLGAYLLGSLLLLRVQVPCRFRHGALALVLGDVEFGFYHQWCALVLGCICWTRLLCQNFLVLDLDFNYGFVMVILDFNYAPFLVASLLFLSGSTPFLLSLLSLLLPLAWRR